MFFLIHVKKKYIKLIGVASIQEKIYNTPETFRADIASLYFYNEIN